MIDRDLAEIRQAVSDLPTKRFFVTRTIIIVGAFTLLPVIAAILTASLT